MTAITTIRAMTPKPTPAIDIQVLREINFCDFLALRWRMLTNNS